MKYIETSVERFIFGVLLIGGYFAIGFVGAWVFAKNPAGLQITHDTQITIGPLLGVIVNSIWKASPIDRQNADNMAQAIQKLPKAAAVVETPPNDPLRASDSVVTQTTTTTTGGATADSVSSVIDPRNQIDDGK